MGVRETGVGVNAQVAQSSDILSVGFYLDVLSDAICDELQFVLYEIWLVVGICIDETFDEDIYRVATSDFDILERFAVHAVNIHAEV